MPIRNYCCRWPGAASRRTCWISRLPALETVPRSLCEPRGAFVSLHRQGQLRGCIGYLEAVKPLGQTVREMAAAAAFHDPRFRPLGKEELADLEVEISVLSPMRLIKNIDEIQVGTHGLYIVQGPCRGLLLPQVATEYKWDRLTFLQQTCGKAGLPPDAWKDPDTKIYLFTAEIFARSPQKAGCAHTMTPNGPEKPEHLPVPLPPGGPPRPG